MLRAASVHPLAHGHRRASPARPNLVAMMLMLVVTGCSSATAVWTVKPAAGAGSAATRIFVAPPTVDIGAPTGNVGQNVADVERLLTERILSIVREADAEARIAQTSDDTPFQPMARYIEAVSPSRATRREIDAAGYALEHGGMRLLVPTIVEWRRMRTDDPVGALTLGHNRVVIGLRLVRLDPVALLGSVMFENHARLTVNQSAERLLNDDFRKVLLRLLHSTV